MKGRLFTKGIFTFYAFFVIILDTMLYIRKNKALGGFGLGLDNNDK